MDYLVDKELVRWCSGNAKSQLEPVIEHLVGRQGQLRGAQVHTVQLSDRKGWILAPPFPRPHLKAGSGSESVCGWSSLCSCGLLKVSGGLFLSLFLYL